MAGRVAERAREVCRKHSNHFLAALEDLIVDRYLYRRVLEAARDAGLRVDPGELAGVRSVRELRERTFSIALRYLEENPDALDPGRVLAAVESDGLTARVVGALVTLLAGMGADAELTYEDAVAIARECGLRRTYAYLTRYPNVSRFIVSLVSSLAKAYRESLGSPVVA